MQPWRCRLLALCVRLGAARADQQPPAADSRQLPRAAPQDPQRDVIRRSVDLVTTDVIVRDRNGQFIADLKKDEFEVFEDGVKQEIVSFMLTHGGRVYNVRRRRRAPVQEGIILPPQPADQRRRRAASS